MARKILIVDDVTGDEGAEEGEFAFRGITYQIDLTTEGWEQLEDLLQPYITSGRKQGTGKGVAIPKSKIANDGDAGSHTPQEVAALKQWCVKNGVQTPHARISLDVWGAYRRNDVSLLRPGRMIADQKPERGMAEAS